MAPCAARRSDQLVLSPFSKPSCRGLSGSHVETCFDAGMPVNVSLSLIDFVLFISSIEFIHILSSFRAGMSRCKSTMPCRAVPRRQSTVRLRRAPSVAEMEALASTSAKRRSEVGATALGFSLLAVGHSLALASYQEATSTPTLQ